jgi:hypothetical protein
MNLLEAAGRVLLSPAFKFVLILFLIVLLLVPLALVYGLIWERENRAASVRRESVSCGDPSSACWGRSGRPHTVRIETVQGDKRFEQIHGAEQSSRQSCSMSRRAEAKTLRRSIFEVPVYAARLKLSGRGLRAALPTSLSEVVAVRWRDAAFVLGLTGVSGLKEPPRSDRRCNRHPFAPSGTGQPTLPASTPSSPAQALACCPIPSSRRSRSTSPSTSPSMARFPSPWRRSRARRAWRLPPTGRTRASPAPSCPTNAR